LCESLSEVPDLEPDTICLIAGRTQDNPSFFEQCLDKGCKTIYLEKPGAPDVQTLTRMRDLAASRTIPCKVYLGYNKNVTKYVREAMGFSSSLPGAGHLEFVHNNSYQDSEESLGECFERNSEGILKNMAIHELALLVSFFGIRESTVRSIHVDRKETELLELMGRKDFRKIRFTIESLSGVRVSVKADRCGGDVSTAIVRSPKSLKEVKRFNIPKDKKEEEEMKKKCLADPEMMPYFFSNSEDYWVLKDRVISALKSDETAEGVATIDVAIEALRLAEFVTVNIQYQLANK